MRKAINIVLSKSLDGNDRKACIFYSDGSVENVSYKDTISMLNDMEKNKTIFNESKIYVMTEAELNRRFDNFVVEVPKPKTIEEAIERAFNSLTEESFVEIKQEDSIYITIPNSKESNNNSLVNTKLEEITPVIEESSENIVNEFEDLEGFNEELNNQEKKNELVIDTITEKEIKTEIEKESEDLAKIFTIKEGLSSTNILEDNTNENSKDDINVVNEEEEAFNKDKEDFIEENLTDAESPVTEEIVTKKDKILYLLRKFDPFNKISHRVGAVALATVMASTVVSCAKPEPEENFDFTGAEFVAPLEIDDKTNDSENNIINNKENKSSEIETVAENKVTTTGETKTYDDNTYYNNYTFDQLLEVTTNQTQKKAMQNIGEALDWYNGPFADQFVEEDKDVRTALTWDEMVALQMAYNDYSKYDLHAIFNGAEVDANKLTSAYKNATLQLICAYILEDEDSLVDISKFIQNEEDLTFVREYQNLLEAVKNSTGEERSNYQREFINKLSKDFPISDEERIEGISHADIDIIESKRLAVAPIVQAFELISRNEISLDDKQFDYFDTLGLCNIAEAKFEKIETITLACCEEDKTNPTYEQFRSAKIKELINKNIYVIDDEHRDLSKLDRFKQLVNGNIRMSEEGFYEENVWYEENTYKIVKKWKVTKTKKTHKIEKIETTDRDKAVREAGEKKVKEAEEEVDKKIEEENKKVKEEAEEKAKENQEEMQKEEDKKKEELEEEVKLDEEDLEKDIEDANKQIEENNKDEDKTNDDPINEEDFGDHNVDFDDEHSDNNGNLDDSVKDITTDDSNVKEVNDLPDPNETGAAFDAAYEEEEVVVKESTHEESAPAPKEESTPKVESKPVETSNEKAVNDYVEKQANEPQQDEEEKVLVKE